VGRNKKYKTKAEKLAANRLASKKWYEENKNKKITEKCSFQYENCNELRNHKGGTYCQYHYQIMAKANKYKITPLQVLELYKETNCNICNTELNDKSCIDHNHITMQVRGVLCNNCNVIIGLAKEDKKILKNTIKYLKKYDK
jgi:hypothetical protein